SRPEQFRFIADGASDPSAAEELFRDMNSVDSGSDDNSGGSVQSVGAASPMVGGDTMDYLRRTALDAQVSSDKILEITRRVKPASGYPSSQLASSLSLVARLIAGGMTTRVYYVSQGGYDTHSGENNTHDRLMSDLDTSLFAFVSDLKAQGNFDRVMLMTFSE